MTGKAPLVLDVGNCDLDHGNISALLEQHFQAMVHRAHGSDDALAAVRRERYDLVTINRLMDCDGAQGLSVTDDPVQLVKSRWQG